MGPTKTAPPERKPDSESSEHVGERSSPSLRLIRLMREELQEREEALDELTEEPSGERWLVSYSDMMTLLFGFFVLLYSMLLPNGGGFEKLKKLAENQFGASQPVPGSPASPAEVSPPQPPAEDPGPLHDQIRKLEAESSSLSQLAESLKSQLAQARSRTATAESQLNGMKGELDRARGARDSSAQAAGRIHELEAALNAAKEGKRKAEAELLENLKERMARRDPKREKFRPGETEQGVDKPAPNRFNATATGAIYALTRASDQPAVQEWNRLKPGLKKIDIHEDPEVNGIRTFSYTLIGNMPVTPGAQLQQVILKLRGRIVCHSFSNGTGRTCDDEMQSEITPLQPAE